MNVITKISCYLERSVVRLKLHKEYLNALTYNTSVLFWIKKTEQFDIYTLFYVNIYRSYKLSKHNLVFLAHPVLLLSEQPSTIKLLAVWLLCIF